MSEDLSVDLGKPDDKKEKGGDKADDKVSSMLRVQLLGVLFQLLWLQM